MLSWARSQSENLRKRQKFHAISILPITFHVGKSRNKQSQNVTASGKKRHFKLSTKEYDVVTGVTDSLAGFSPSRQPRWWCDKKQCWCAHFRSLYMQMTFGSSRQVGRRDENFPNQWKIVVVDSAAKEDNTKQQSSTRSLNNLLERALID